MTGRRTYGDRCGIARALDLVGERWALLVVRELLLGPKRFTDLRAGLAHVGPDVLAQRLRDLEASGILRRAKLPPPAAAQVYELTERGQALEPVILELGRWGSREPALEGTELGPDSAMLALKTMFDPAAATGLTARYEVRLGEYRYDVRVADGRLDIRRGGVDGAEAVIETDVPGLLAAVLWHGESAELLALHGSREAFDRFARLFPWT
jgi:DNA-binding HxlR family transcriptional regulator